ncbi:hypothetical protein NEAUS06_1607 [Nematocida ausubeli]|nr:hypothetical protein NEAUS06_1607 [Nematocida ausubeli]
MFQKSAPAQKHTRNKKTCGSHTEERSVFDQIAVAIMWMQLAQCNEGVLYHISYLCICGFLAHIYTKSHSRDEVLVGIGSIYWLLQKTQIQAELFFAIGTRNLEIPFVTALRQVAMYGIKALIKDVKKENGLMLWAQCIAYISLSLCLLCLLVYSRASLNVKRKAFHYILFFYCYLFPSEIVMVHLVCILFLFQLASRIIQMFGHIFKTSEKEIFSLLTSEKDEKEVTSHIILLSSFICVIGGVQKDRNRMLFILSGVGIIDSVACFFKKSQNTHKSMIGAMVGAISAKVTLCCLGIHYPLWMYMVLGMAEYKSKMNDNIILPVIGYAISSFPCKYA